MSGKPVNPTQLPVAGARFLVRTLSKPGSLVLDLFGGTGTCSVAALTEGRDALCVDVDGFQVDNANQRVDLMYETEVAKQHLKAVYDADEQVPANVDALVDAFKQGKAQSLTTLSFSDILDKAMDVSSTLHGGLKGNAASKNVEYNELLDIFSGGYVQSGLTRDIFATLCKQADTYTSVHNMWIAKPSLSTYFQQWLHKPDNVSPFNRVL